MSKEEIFEVVKKSIMSILKNISSDDITIEKSLKELGGDSIDRVEIMTVAIENLAIKIPLVELGRAKDIRGLIEIFYEKINE